MAARELPPELGPGSPVLEVMDQDTLEAGAAFLGLVLMVNPLKADTKCAAQHGTCRCSNAVLWSSSQSRWLRQDAHTLSIHPACLCD